MRTIRKLIPVESFFNFFSPPSIPEDTDDLTEDELGELRGRLECDYEVGDLFKTKIIPAAVYWFTGKALEYDGFVLPKLWIIACLIDNDIVPRTKMMTSAIR